MAKPVKVRPAAMLGEVIDILDGQKIATYTREDAGYEYLKNGNFCVAVLNPVGEDDLYIDLEDGFTLTYGDWNAHYEATERDFEHLRQDIIEFLSGRMYLASVYSGKEWLCSLTMHENDVSKAHLFKQTADFLHSADCDPFIQLLKNKGGMIDCRFWNVKRDREIRIRPGEFR
ncbi:MAG: hypothetical protein ACI4ET_09375 [Bilifractor sp.]